MLSTSLGKDVFNNQLPADCSALCSQLTNSCWGPSHGLSVFHFQVYSLFILTLGQKPQLLSVFFFHRPISQFPCTFCLTKKTCFPERLFLWGPFKINWIIVLCLYFCHLICKNLLSVATGVLSLHVFILFCIWSFYRAAWEKILHFQELWAAFRTYTTGLLVHSCLGTHSLEASLQLHFAAVYIQMEISGI